MKHVYPVIGGIAVIALALAISSPVLLAVGVVLTGVSMLVSTMIMGWRDGGAAGAIASTLRIVLIGAVGGVAGAAMVNAAPQTAECSHGCRTQDHAIAITR